MIDMTTGAVAGIAAGEVQQSLHASPTQKPAEVHLLEIYECLREICDIIKWHPVHMRDKWTIIPLSNQQAYSLGFEYAKNLYQTLHLLVTAPATLTVSPSGMPSFSMVFEAAPTAGHFPLGVPVRMRYPERTTIQLALPTLASGYFNIGLLYSDETGI